MKRIKRAVIVSFITFLMLLSGAVSAFAAEPRLAVSGQYCLNCYSDYGLEILGLPVDEYYDWVQGIYVYTLECPNCGRHWFYVMDVSDEPEEDATCADQNVFCAK